jgi:hypothetical protein
VPISLAAAIFAPIAVALVLQSRQFARIGGACWEKSFGAHRPDFRPATPENRAARPSLKSYVQDLIALAAAWRIHLYGIPGFLADQGARRR